MTALGSFDSRTHGIPFDLAPYGRMELGHGIGTISLIQCSAVAVQIVHGGFPTRLDVGASVPVNGHQRFVRNPFSFPISGHLLEDLPTQIVQPIDPSRHDFRGAHSLHYNIGLAAHETRKQGVFLMCKRGQAIFDVQGNDQTSVSIIPRAELSYIDQMPATMLASDAKFYGSNGLVAENIIARMGRYVDTEVGEWVGQVGTQCWPVPVTEKRSASRVYVTEETAAVVFVDIGQPLQIDLTGLDLGDWSPEWQG